MKTFIIYGTNFCTSEKVSNMLKEKIKGEVIVKNINNLGKINLCDADNIIIGASIKVGQIQKEVKEWLSNEKDVLLKKNTYFFLCAGEKDETKRNQFWELNYPKELLAAAKAKVWAGAEINLDKLNFFSKLLIKNIMGQKKSSSNLQINEINHLADLINK